ncbi:DUF6682 family protein [Comamonas thiooxydans]|uniref:phage adaptor protein n=1 Tax=Comamonas thiooxydans TaxID=363952 RepID=UPI00050EE9F2|nr:DUF6682 family protein [Comamonas thiooxydans]KGH29228.1 hypothetical protein P606_02165 [Comamonas thiooxydans]MDH1477571.1 hypothetical protein [Comamonas thiooxydans]
MPIAAKDVIQRGVVTTQDTTSIRWPVGEWVRYLNDGQREIMLHRPDAFNKSAVIDCVAGTKQALPADGAKLIDVQRNSTAASKRAVRICSREILDAQMPNWHNIAGAAEIVHFMYDPREPKAFWVYPPATVAAKLEINYSATPTDIAEPEAGSDYTAVAGNLSVADIYANSLLDYMLYRVYLKDADYAGNGARAQAHYAAFATALGIDLKATLSAAPVSVGNPNFRQGSSAATVPVGQ